MKMSEKPIADAPTEQKAADLPIDDGFRRWYASCPCCLGESYPTVKAKIEAEQQTAR